MAESSLDQDLDAARRAAEYAREVRRYHRKRTDRNSPQRSADISVAMDRIRAAMRPLRGRIGRYPYGPQTETASSAHAAVKEASAALQAERRRLWKMQNHVPG
jgi:hypothetical protein